MSVTVFGQPFLFFLLGFSVLVLVITPLLAIWFVLKLPSDYLITHTFSYRFLADSHPVIRMILKTLGNVLGGFFIIAGILMLVFPGQGVLSIVVGLILMDFPRKHFLLSKLLRLKMVVLTINKLRAWAGVPLMEVVN